MNIQELEDNFADRVVNLRIGDYNAKIRKTKDGFEGWVDTPKAPNVHIIGTPQEDVIKAVLDVIIRYGKIL